LSREAQERITDKNITKLFKQPDGNARFVQITKTEDVIHLAGQLGYFDLTDDYGIKEQYDITMAIGIAAGIEALKDANIPLVMQYKPVRDGKGMIPDGFALPPDMQEETGVIITSLWPNGETLISELEKYFYEKWFLKPYEEFENIYYYLMEKVKELDIKEQLTEWFFKAKSGKRKDFETYKFNRDFLANACPLGSAHLAQIIKAKGPNTLVSSACASTTLAIGIAEDWIRVGRCKRVLVVGGENATSDLQNQWVGSGFLALGAATIKKRVSEAAKPFDEDRNGTILGAGAVGLVIENESSVRARGMNGQCEILGTHIANSAYHTYNIDVPHMSKVMKTFIDKVERQNNLKKEDYADKLLFMSHETYTPARGGSADAEVTALETAFSGYLNRICISNTKGFTGHTLGAAIEDVVLVKALQYRKAPPIANLKKIPEHFKMLNFSGQDKIDSEYGLHLAAGFGSHFAFMFVKRIQENTVENNAVYHQWLQKITGSADPELKLIDNTLCVVPGSSQLIEAVAPQKPAAAPVKPAPVVTPAAAVSARSDGPDVRPEPSVAAPVPANDLPVKDPIETVKKIIAEQTGYTVDMLEPELDLEADLGIDTVKQVEIFAKIAADFRFAVPDDLKLRELNTIARLSGYITSRIGAVPLNEPVKPAPVPEAADASEPAPGSMDAMTTVKAVIAEQTGYTVDMLEPELDLEADLGIDTVKQVEIFAKIAAHFKFSVPDDLKLRELNTIARLSDYISKKSNAGAATPAGSVSAPATIPVQPAGTLTGAAIPAPESDMPSGSPDIFPDPASPIKRLVVRTRQADIPEGSDRDLTGKIIVVSLDRHGFAKKVIENIQAQNGRVITIGRHGADVEFDLTHVRDTRERLETFKKNHPVIDGFIHLAPLDYYFMPASEERESDAALNTIIKSCFVIIQSLYQTLDRSGCFIGTLTFDSVVFPYMEDCGEIYPLFAGLSGLLKTVNKEMTKTRVKVVDFSYKQPIRSIDRISSVFMNELTADDPRCEAGYKNKKRYVLTMAPSVADRSGQVIRRNDTLLVTGGAGGITYEILKQVVATYHTNLVILDINDIYSTDAKYLDKEANASRLMAFLKQDMPDVKPVEIKRALDRLMRVRQSIDNIEYLKSLGVRVDYHCVDVTDAAAVKAAMDRHDKIDGIFHAAGMEMSQFIPKKELWAFELVVDVKVKGLRNLLAAAEGRDYRYFFTFSSVTARFGNEGQGDYTAANDFLGKALFREKQRHQERIFKVYAWTAWGGVGMATNPTVKAVLEERGIQFLPMDQGIRFFMADLLDTRESEMVFSGMDYSFDRDGLLKDPLGGRLPFLDTLVEKTPAHVVCTRTLDIAKDRFLLDHAMDDTPVFLGATGIEAMAETALLLAGEDKRLTQVTRFSIPYGIKLLKKRPKEIIIQSREQDGKYRCEISSVFKNPKGVVMGEPKQHYQGDYIFSDRPLKPEKRDIPEFFEPVSDIDLTELIYHPQRLFMDGVFRTIQKVLSFDGHTLVCRICDRSTDEFFTGNSDPHFITNVALLDGMFQTGGVFEFLTDSMVVLPFKIGHLKIFEKGNKHENYLCITTRTASDDETDTFQMDLVTETGSLLVKLTDFQMVKLNKLSEEHLISRGVTVHNGVTV
jgi:3-oxoacyl-(acyl-carrier-protein) synthase/acyl carrier protein/NAD(P)-dependent dehydrogenase (short-subunit alcohol dehydrogenase family)